MSIQGRRRRQRVACGSSQRNPEVKRIPIGFDVETFDQIAAAARASQISFAERARQLVELGLETERLGMNIKGSDATTKSSAPQSR
jgi:hypothetical protein